MNAHKGEIHGLDLMVINTNIAAQSSARLLGESSSLLSKSLARLSSGSKLVSPGDDAAGLSVSMRFDAQINRIAASMSNLGNATSFSQTQDGFLKKIGKSLDRMSELAVLAQDVTKSDPDRVLYNKEFQTLASYINDVTAKDFNGVSLFSSTALNVTSDSDGGTFQMTGISGDYLTPAASPHPALTTKLSDVTGPGMLGWVNVDPFGVSTVWDTDFTVGSFLNSLNGALSYLGNHGSASYDATSGVLTVTVNPGANVNETDGMLTALGLHDLDNTGGSDPVTMTSTLTTSGPSTPSSAPDISTLDGAKSALTTVKAAIDQLATDRATVGASIARLSLTSDQLGTLKDNLSAANSRIKDVDVGEESTQFARYSILVQAGTAMLAQANAVPQSVLRLLG